MKRLIFFVMVLCSTVFSAEMNITKEDMEWRSKVTLGIHGDNKSAWTERVKIPEKCNSSLETKLSDITTISLNVLNKKPEDWLKGKYLQYVNENCDLFGVASVTQEGFERTIENYFRDTKKDNIIKVKDIPMYMILGGIAFIPFIITLFFSKNIITYIKRIWFS